MEFGTISLVSYKFEVKTAIMFPYSLEEDPSHIGWGFFFGAGEPFEEPPLEEDEISPFWLGISLYTDGAPIPLPDQADFSGLEFSLKEPYDPESGEVYFTFNAAEAQDVHDVHIHFLEKQDSRYRIVLSALVDHVFEEPAPLGYEGWIQLTDAAPAGF